MERAALGNRLERGEMADLDVAQPTMIFDRSVHLVAFYESVRQDDAVGMKRFDLELRLLFAMAVANGVAESSIIPLTPGIRDDLGLSAVQTGLLWTTTTIAMLFAAVPVGYAANRFGSRWPLIASAALMPLALVGQAVAVGLAGVLFARLLFGLSFGILWVIGPARAGAGGRGAGGIGPLIAAAGIGWLVGPVVAGATADVTDWRVASAVLAVLTLPIVPVVYRFAAPRLPGEHVDRLQPREAFGLVRRNRVIAGAVLVSAMLGVVGGASNVLVPLALDAEGLSAGKIGLAFGIASAVWIASSMLVGRLRASVVTLRGIGVVVAVLAGAWLLPALRPTALAIVAFLVVSTSCRAMVNALNYAVGVRSVLGDAAPVVVGVLNLAWAVMALVSPLLAGLAEGSASVRIAFAATGAVTAAVALALLGPRLHFRTARAVSSAGRAGDS
jgi:predicted MFS family arabinose efflux permease